MNIAIPLENGVLCQHFGQCAEFGFIDGDPATKKVGTLKVIQAPAHSPGALPPWVKQQGATLVIAGGMGERARQIFEQNGIEVILGAPSETPQKLVQAYLDGKLASQGASCTQHAGTCGEHDHAHPHPKK